ncbi:MAG: hypothetical protein WKG00_27295 [Polyangiaceae bacterium]
MGAREDFTYDAQTFVVGEAGGVDVRKLEADYAEMFMEALARRAVGGDATAASLESPERERLDRAADIFGLDRGRLLQIEQAMEADFQARRSLEGAVGRSAGAVTGSATTPVPAGTVSRGLRGEVAGAEDADDGARLTAPQVGGPEMDGERGSVLPSVGDSDDPRIFLLLDRIARLEARNGELEARCAKLEASSALLEARAGHGASVDGAAAAQVPPARSSHLAREGGDDRFGRAGGDWDARLGENPRDLGVLQRLYRALRRAADVDRRHCVAQVLVFLGGADDDQRRSYERVQKGALPHPHRSLSADDWQNLLRHPDQDELIGQIFGEVSAAVLLARIAAARAAGSLPQLDADKKVDPQTSPLAAARAVAWSAAVLGIGQPPVYADTSFPGVVEMLFTTPLSTRIGAGAQSGRAPRELAFVMGRHMAWYRREGFMSLLAGSVGALEDLFLAALTIGNPSVALTPDVRRRADRVAGSIEPLLDPPASLRLRASFLRFVEQGGRANVRRWAAATDRTAARAGLLLADDLAAAQVMLELEDAALARTRMDDLLAFAVSERYGALRAKIGIALAEE